MTSRFLMTLYPRSRLSNITGLHPSARRAPARPGRSGLPRAARAAAQRRDRRRRAAAGGAARDPARRVAHAGARGDGAARERGPARRGPAQLHRAHADARLQIQLRVRGVDIDTTVHPARRPDAPSVRRHPDTVRGRAVVATEDGARVTEVTLGLAGEIESTDTWPVAAATTSP